MIWNGITKVIFYNFTKEISVFYTVDRCFPVLNFMIHLFDIHINVKCEFYNCLWHAPFIRFDFTLIVWYITFRCSRKDLKEWLNIGANFCTNLFGKTIIFWIGGIGERVINIDCNHPTSNIYQRGNRLMERPLRAGSMQKSVVPMSFNNLVIGPVIYPIN